MLGDAEDVDAPAGDFHDEQHVESAQPDGVEMEEVGGQQAGRLGAEERPPVRVYPTRCRPQVCGGQDAADGAGADVVSESGELALDAAVTPGWVLLCQADDELTELVVEARTTGQARVGPFLGDQASVPGHQGGGGDEAVAAQFAGQDPGQGGQECPVGPGWAGWAESPA
jgi:hypothetical protein